MLLLLLLLALPVILHRLAETTNAICVSHDCSTARARDDPASHGYARESSDWLILRLHLTLFGIIGIIIGCSITLLS